MLNYQNHNKLSPLQIELLKVLKYQTTPQSLAEIKSLLRFYFAHKLDKAIEQVENERNYTKEVYKSWLENHNASGSKKSK